MHALLRRSFALTALTAGLLTSFATAPAFANDDEGDGRRDEIRTEMRALRQERDDALELIAEERELVKEEFKESLSLLRLDLEDALDALEAERADAEAACESGGCTDEEYLAMVEYYEGLEADVRAAFSAEAAELRAGYREAMAALRDEMRAVMVAYRDQLAALRAELRALREATV